MVLVVVLSQRTATFLSRSKTDIITRVLLPKRTHIFYWLSQGKPLQIIIVSRFTVPKMFTQVEFFILTLPDCI